MTIFWDVDTQYDFMTADGKLYVTDAETILDNLRLLTILAEKYHIRRFGSIDYHQEGDAELSENPDFMETFPPHCMAGSAGAQKIKETAPSNPIWVDQTLLTDEEIEEILKSTDREVIFRKQKFDVFSNPNTMKILSRLKPDRIFIYGVALDVCVAHAINGMLKNKVKAQLYLVEDAVKAIYPKTGEQYMADWEKQKVKRVKREDIEKLIA